MIYVALCRVYTYAALWFIGKLCIYNKHSLCILIKWQGFPLLFCDATEIFNMAAFDNNKSKKLSKET